MFAVVVVVAFFFVVVFFSSLFGFLFYFILFAPLASGSLLARAKSESLHVTVKNLQD